MNKIQWVDNAGGLFRVNIGYCPSKEAFQKYLKSVGMDGEIPWEGEFHQGLCYKLPAISDNTVGTILIYVNREVLQDELKCSSTILHECVHAFQFICDFWGEDSPSREFEAYGIQYIYDRILEAYIQCHKTQSNV